MIADFKPYRAMKDSSVEWLGEVPEHWEIRRARYLFAEIDQRSKAGEETHLSMSQRLGLVPSDEVQSSLTSESYAGGKLCEREDLVLNRLKAHLGVFALANQPGVISPDYSVFRHKCALNMTYFEQVLRSPACRGELRVRAKGIVEGFWRLYTDDFFDIRLPLPPLSEQTAIVRYLDYVDRRVRRLVRAKQKLIALLTEQKQAIIHRAVTRGLDPAVPPKDSGVEWLGEVPEHWEVVPIRRVSVSRCDGPFGSGLKSSHYTDQGVRVVRLQNIGHAEFRDSDAAYIDEAYYATLGDHSVESGDLLIAGLGDERHPAGRACVAPQGIGPAMVKADCFRFRLDLDRCVPKFLALQLSSTADVASALLSRGATRQRTNLQSTSSREAALPCLNEQASIVKSIDEATAGIDAAATRANREIELLDEYRTRLIADVVTGKLDVRAVATSLPEVAPLAAEDDLDDTADPEAEADFDDLDTISKEAEA